MLIFSQPVHTGCFIGDGYIGLLFDAFKYGGKQLVPEVQVYFAFGFFCPKLVPEKNRSAMNMEPAKTMRPAFLNMQ